MRYFITGATGFVGGQVARQLAGAGHQVIALVRDPARASDLAQAGIELARGDVTERESLRAPMTGADGVFHVAGWYKIGQRDAATTAAAINVQGTRNVLETMRDLAIPKGVYTSTVAVFSDTHGQRYDESHRYNGPHLSVYDETKWRAHYEVAEPLIRQGLPLAVVMPGLVYGPGDTSAIHEALVQYLTRKLPMVPLGTAYSWGYIDDIARGHLLAMERGKAGEEYIIAGPTYSLLEALELARDITGVPLPRLRAAPGMLRALAGVMGLVERVVPVPAQYTAEYLRVGAGVSYLGDNAKARRDLGYDPRPLAEGLRDTLLYEMRQLGMPLPAAPTPQHSTTHNA
jgi:nucleoside-diphosphate-sugar epimerase